MSIYSTEELIKNNAQLNEVLLRDEQARNYLNEYRESKGFWWDELEKQLLIKGVNAKSGMVILDAGCGVGRLSFVLAEKGCQVNSIDFSPESIRLLLHSHLELQNKIQTQVHDLTLPLPFVPDIMDGVISCQTVQHIPIRSGRVSAWRNMLYVAKPGAPLATMVYHFNKNNQQEGQFDNGLFYHRYSSADLLSELTEAGWSVERLSVWYRQSWKHWHPRMAIIAEKILSTFHMFDYRGHYLLVIARKPVVKS